MNMPLGSVCPVCGSRVLPGADVASKSVAECPSGRRPFLEVALELGLDAEWTADHASAEGLSAVGAANSMMWRVIGAGTATGGCDARVHH